MVCWMKINILALHINCTVKGYKVLSLCFMVCWIKINILALCQLYSERI